MFRKCFLVLLGTLCGGVVFLWVRSYWIIDSCQLPLGSGNYHSIGVISDRGGITFSSNYCDRFGPKRLVITSTPVRELNGQFAFLKDTILDLTKPAPFGYSRFFKKWPDGSSMRRVSLRIPYGIIILVVAAGFSYCAWSWVFRSYVRRKSGKCPSCGYDLRGLVISRCPECGIPFNIKGNTSS